MPSDRVSAMDTSATAPQALGAGRGVSAWLDRHSSKVFILPAVIVILAFSIFPLIVSAYLSLTRFRLAPGGFELRWAGFRNFDRLLFGSEQYHSAGHVRRLRPGSSWTVMLGIAGLIIWWLVRLLVLAVLHGRDVGNDRTADHRHGWFQRIFTDCSLTWLVLSDRVRRVSGFAGGDAVLRVRSAVGDAVLPSGWALRCCAARPIRGRNAFSASSSSFR